MTSKEELLKQANIARANILSIDIEVDFGTTFIKAGLCASRLGRTLRSVKRQTTLHKKKTHFWKGLSLYAILYTAFFVYLHVSIPA